MNRLSLLKKMQIERWSILQEDDPEGHEDTFSLSGFFAELFETTDRSYILDR
jgi:hypothetical protein